MQLYLGRWQQTDLAVKMLSKVMQNLSPQSGVVPQDPSTSKAWRETSGRGPDVLQHEPADASSVSDGSSALAAEDLHAMKTLEREVLHSIFHAQAFKICCCCT